MTLVKFLPSPPVFVPSSSTSLPPAHLPQLLRPAGVSASADRVPGLRGATGVGGPGRDAKTRGFRKQRAREPTVRPANALQGMGHCAGLTKSCAYCISHLLWYDVVWCGVVFQYVALV